MHILRGMAPISFSSNLEVPIKVTDALEHGVHETVMLKDPRLTSEISASLSYRILLPAHGS